MTKSATYRDDYDTRTKTPNPFPGIVDEKGRQVGAIVVINTRTYSGTPEDPRYGYDFEPGDYIYVEVQAARDGIKYGASHTGKSFKTKAEAINYYRGQVDAMRTRYKRKYGKGV